jgi:hypothetical protein
MSNTVEVHCEATVEEEPPPKVRSAFASLAAGRVPAGEFEQIVSSFDATLVRPDRKNEKPRFGKLGGVRQWIESIYNTTKDQLNLEHGGRIPEGEKPLSAMMISPPVSSCALRARSSIAAATSRSPSLAGARQKLTGIPSGAHKKYSRSPQKWRECDAQ